MTLLAALATAAGSLAQSGFTIDPAMVKGPASAAVTIIEFSDYQ